MRHVWTLVVLMTASTLAEYRTLYGGNLMVSNGGYINNRNTGIISGSQRDRPFENVGNQAGYGFFNGDISGASFGQRTEGSLGSSNGGEPFFTSGRQRGGPLAISGSMPGDGLVNRESSGGSFGQGNTGLIRGSKSGGPFKVNVDQESIMYGGQSEGPIRSQSSDEIVNSGSSGGLFGQRRTGLVRGSNSEGPFQVNAGQGIIAGNQIGGSFGNQGTHVNAGSGGGSSGQGNIGLIRGSNTGGPFRVNADQESIISGRQNEGLFGNQARDVFVNVGSSGGPFGQEKTGLIRGSNSGGPFQVNVGQEGNIAGALGGSSGNHVAHVNAGTGGGLIGGSNTGGPFRVNADQESILSGRQNEGLFGNQAMDKLVSGGSSGGPFEQGQKGLIRGMNSGEPFQLNVGQEGITSGSHSGGTFGNAGNMPVDGLVNGHNTGGPYGRASDRLIRSSSGEGPFRSNGRIISESQNGGPFGNQAVNGLVKGGVNGGPFGKIEGGLIQSSSSGGPFKATGEQDGITSGGQSGNIFRNSSANGLINGSGSGGPFM
ncbi:uncharacterized transmembrane protein DDB_G0289901-like [Drosophila novamexicana]|uniref:uncharacterized transmembrane protein DDB_G0289901-like n=1 Tax=Drosophila novamexicana TaxID=47314 RepID=UPI0011E5977F|nr:uncharacterized transmembrane protein DDB_G0289901-like [Drosophila novamexicana]XP_030554544.1 uncharacterized transmembrane protein DDB_G0289901-like [Drosophila novamexicana]